VITSSSISSIVAKDRGTQHSPKINEDDTLLPSTIPELRRIRGDRDPCGDQAYGTNGSPSQVTLYTGNRDVARSCQEYDEYGAYVDVTEASFV
jgi:hypothetical protein